ncbi:sulfotransferase family 2 domain-containing protein [Leisingera aquaemixtae]|uniref:sulfotransferase family 2 domain-containing protein n=1 Tax=Leisingera aquaemixtae TaxID=1396826 RepID=UPI0039845A90
MAIVSEKYKLAYFPIHKAANTSLKEMMYQIEYDRPFKAASEKREMKKRVHSFFAQTAAFSKEELKSLDGYWRFSVVRDPVQRIISCYTNRMDQWSKAFKKALENEERRETLLADGIEAYPSAEAFFLNLAAYRKNFVRVRRHTDLSSVFLGPDLNSFDGIYPIENLDQLKAELSERIGKPVEIPKTNRSRKSVTKFSPEALDALFEYAEPEYEFLSEFYSRQETERKLLS